MCTNNRGISTENGQFSVLKSHEIGTESIRNIVFCTESVQKLLYVKLLKKYGVCTEIVY